MDALGMLPVRIAAVRMTRSSTASGRNEDQHSLGILASASPRVPGGALQFVGRNELSDRVTQKVKPVPLTLRGHITE